MASINLRAGVACMDLLSEAALPAAPANVWRPHLGHPEVHREHLNLVAQLSFN